MSADGVEREEVMLEGPQQEAVSVDEADGFSKVVKRTVVKSGGDQTEVGNLYSVHNIVIVLRWERAFSLFHALLICTCFCIS